MTLSPSSLSIHSTLAQAFLTFITHFNRSLPGLLLILLLLTPLRLNSCSSDSKNQLAKIYNSSLDASHSARNLGFIFDEHLIFSDQITSLFKACYYHIHQLRCIRTSILPLLPLLFTPNLISVILSTINSQSLNLSSRQLIQNSLVLSVVKAPKSCHITPIQRSLYWLRITERPISILHNLISTFSQYSLFIRCYSCSATDIILSKITGRSFRYALPCLWNQPPLSLRQLQFLHFWLTYSFTYHFFLLSSPLCSSITPYLFHARLETYLFHKSYPVVSLHLRGLPSRSFARTVSSELLGFCF